MALLGLISWWTISSHGISSGLFLAAGWSYHSIQDFSVKMLFMELMIEQASTLVESIVPWPRVEKCPSHSIIRPVSRVECNCSLLSNKDFSS